MTRVDARSLSRIITSVVRLRVGRPLTVAPLSRGGPLVHVDLRRPLGLGHYRYGNTEPAVAVVETLLSPGATFIDGGANVGVFTLYAVRAVGPTGRVIAVEAAPGTLALLRRNIALNAHATNVTLVHAALGAAEGRADLVVFEPGSGTSSISPADASSGQKLSVPARTLDDLGAEIEGACVIKLDIEGSELLALQGATDLLTRVRPDLVLEVEEEHLQRQGASSVHLRRLLADQNYGWCPDMTRPADIQALPLEGPWPAAGEPVNVVARPLESC